MLYRISREAVAAGEGSLPPVFKMKKTREELRLARRLLEENELAVHEGEDELLTKEGALHCVRGMTKDMINVADMESTEPGVMHVIEGEVTEDGGQNEPIEGLSTLSLDSSMTEEDDYGSVEGEQNEQRRTEVSAYVVSHPWHIVDYHLYLCSAEKGQTLEVRRDGMYLFDGTDCRHLPYAEFAEDRALTSQCFPGDQPQLLFGTLPIADHYAGDRSPSFGGRHYVLGFDYHCKTLYARHFDWFPHDLEDMWCVWDSSSNVYTVTVPDLIHIMDTRLANRGMHVGMGILSSSEYCLALESDDDPGLEIVIATLWCQWLLDFSDILFQQNNGTLPDFQARLSSYAEQGRLILQRASYRAWFAMRDGYTKEQYKSMMTINQYTNDLYTFEKSEQDGSLKGQSWAAPGLETCNHIRNNARMERKKRVEQRLEDLFIVPETETAQDQETVLKDILAKSQQGVMDLSAIAGAEVPRTPSLKSEAGTPAPSERCFSPVSPGIVTPVTEPCDELEVPGIHHIPLHKLLERALDSVNAYPELDTLANRSQLALLLENMGIGIQQPALGPALGADHYGTEVRVVRRKEWTIIRSRLHLFCRSLPDRVQICSGSEPATSLRRSCVLGWLGCDSVQPHHSTSGSTLWITQIGAEMAANRVYEFVGTLLHLASLDLAVSALQGQSTGNAAVKPVKQR
ncbi:hypothetical protein BDV06DRAFT_208874 [Aspergillus oleicola]